MTYSSSEISNSKIGLFMVMNRPTRILGSTHNYFPREIEVEDWRNMTKIVLPDSVETIMSGAFMHTNLEEIKMNDGLKTIGAVVFMYTNVTELTIPSSVKKIHIMAFAYARKLKTINIPKKFKKVKFETESQVEFKFY